MGAVIEGMLKEAKARWVKEFPKIRDKKTLLRMIHSLTEGHAGYGRDLTRELRQKLLDKGVEGIPRGELLQAVKASARLQRRTTSTPWRTHVETNLAHGQSRVMQFLKKNPEQRTPERIRRLVDRRSAEPWTGASPEEYVKVRHGGTRSFLERFLRGKTKGYPLERGSGLGIQVHPTKMKGVPQGIKPRLRYYAEKASRGWGGSPAILTGKIQAKHLVGAPNWYEAGLPPSAVKHLKSPKILDVQPRGGR